MSSRLKRGLLLAAACQMAMMSSQSNVFGAPQSLGKARNTLEDGKPIKRQPKQLHEFKIKGHTVMAYSRKDAIKRLKMKGKL